MNMFGNFAGFVAPQVGGIILDATRGAAHPNGDYGMFMYTMAGAYFLGAFCWPFIDPTRRIDQDETESG
jgi:MFS transporter, ACS family, glucarate transporter